MTMEQNTSDLDHFVKAKVGLPTQNKLQIIAKLDRIGGPFLQRKPILATLITPLKKSTME